MSKISDNTNIVYGSLIPNMNDSDINTFKNLWNTSPNYNIYIGCETANVDTTGCNNVFIGYHAGLWSNESSSNKNNHFNGYKKRAERLDKLKNIFNDEL